MEQQVASCRSSCGAANFANVPHWLAEGPLSTFGDPDARVLISMALALAEVLRSVIPLSVGGRAQVPVHQAPPLGTRESCEFFVTICHHSCRSVVPDDGMSILTWLPSEQVTEFISNAPQLPTSPLNLFSCLRQTAGDEVEALSCPAHSPISVVQDVGRLAQNNRVKDVPNGVVQGARPSVRLEG